MGLGSVIYVFVLSAVLWCVAKPLQPERITFLGIATAVAMTAPPAILYAIPVEKWMSLEVANQLNLTFLLIVALWRVALWVRYLRVGCGLGVWKVFLSATLPLVFIFGTLVALNLQHVVFNIMGGIREADKSSQDAAYMFLFVMTYLSLYLSGFAGLGWLITVCARLSDQQGNAAGQVAADSEPATEEVTDELVRETHAPYPVDPESGANAGPQDED
jgi:hypothetical protein